MCKKKKTKTESNQHKSKRLRVAFTIVNPSGKPIPVASAAKYISIPPITAGIASQQPAPQVDDDDDDDDDF